MKIFIYLILLVNLSASTVNLNYIGELSLFGKVADATIYYFNDGENYYIKVSGTGSGIVAKLTNNKHYIYESIGSVNNFELIPHKYIATEINSDINKSKIYTFDYKNSIITVDSVKIEVIDKSKFNIFTFEYDKKEKIVKTKKRKVINKVFRDDMVSIFFNKRNKLLDMKEKESKTIFAVGSKDMENGMLVSLESINNGKFIYNIQLKKDYLDDGNEKAKFVLDSNNILYETSLNGILFFGNAVVKRIN